MRPKGLVLRLGWMLLLTLLGLSLWGAAAQAGEITGQVKPAQYKEVETRGALDLRIQSDEGAPSPPGELLLSDPSGKMTGSDAGGIRYQEIPTSTYRRVTGAYHLHVGNAVSGQYNLRVIGMEFGKYILYMTGQDETGARADISFTMLLEPGQVHHYLIDYSNVAGAKIKARRVKGAEEKMPLPPPNP